MSEETPAGETKLNLEVSYQPGRRLLRFLVAGLIAMMVTFMIILFMRFLIKGYDESTSALITRYISLPRVIISRGKSEETVRPAKPGDRPYIPGLDDPDTKQEPAATLDEQPYEFPLMSIPEQNIDLPQLESAPPGKLEKLQQIKQAILAEDEQAETVVNPPDN